MRRPLLALAFLLLAAAKSGAQEAVAPVAPLRMTDKMSVTPAVDSAFQRASKMPTGAAFCVTEGRVSRMPGEVLIGAVEQWARPVDPECGEQAIILFRPVCAVSVKELGSPVIVIFCPNRMSVIRMRILQ